MTFLNSPPAVRCSSWNISVKTSESGILFYLACPQTSQTALKHRIMYFMWAPFLMLPRFSCAQEARSVISEYPGSDMVCVYPNPSMSLQLKEDGDRGSPVIWIAEGCHQSFSKFLLIPASWPHGSNGLYNVDVSVQQETMDRTIKTQLSLKWINMKLSSTEERTSLQAQVDSFYRSLNFWSFTLESVWSSCFQFKPKT